MKIYTEVIMEWDEDKGELVEVSSESYEHEGDIALCGGGGGGYDPVDPHPLYFHKKLENLPTETPGWTGGSRLPHHLTGKSFAETVHPYYRTPYSDVGEWQNVVSHEPGNIGISTELTGAGYDINDINNMTKEELYEIYNQTEGADMSFEEFSEQVPEAGEARSNWLVGGDGGYMNVFQNLPSNITAREKDIYAEGKSGVPSFAEGWYNPYYEASVQAPIYQTVGKPYSAGEVSVDPSKGQYMAFTDLPFSEGLKEELTNVFQEGYGTSPFEATSQLPFAQGGYGIVPKGYETDISMLNAGLEAIERGFSEELSRIEDEKEIAMDTRDEGLLSARVDRAKAVADRDLEIDASTAPIATFGGAYSAPAERTAQMVKEENIRDLADIKRGEEQLVENYDERITDLEGEEVSAEIGLLEDKQVFGGEVVNVLDKMLGDITDIAALPTEIQAAHKEKGESWGSGATENLNPAIYGRGQWGGYGGSPLFGETSSPAGTFAGQVGSEAEAFNRFMKDTGIANYLNDLTAQIGALSDTGEV